MCPWWRLDLHLPETVYVDDSLSRLRLFPDSWILCQPLDISWKFFCIQTVSSSLLECPNDYITFITNLYSCYLVIIILFFVWLYFYQAILLVDIFAYLFQLLFLCYIRICISILTVQLCWANCFKFEYRVLKWSFRSESARSAKFHR